MKLSHFTKIYPYGERADYLLFYSTRKASSVLLSTDVYHCIKNSTLTDSNTEVLTRLGFLVNDNDEERASMLRVLDEANERNTHLNLIVVMNLDCNLSCRYCYEGAMKGRHYMSRETADLLIGHVMNALTPEKKSLNIDFYGGEPLLSADLIKYISGKIKELSDKKDIDYSFTLISNGTLLTGRAVKELLPLGFTGVKITLDGARENHNAFRPYKSGAGSFDRIIRNIKETCEMIKIGIGGNFSRENYRGFPLLLDYLLDEGLTPDKISNIKFDPITKTHNEQAPTDFKDIGCSSIDEPWLIEAGFLLREEILKRGFRTYKMTPSPCMIDIRDDFVVNHDGSIYKCPGLIGTKDFEVGDLRSGMHDYRESHNLDLWKNGDCIDCKYLPLCFGGCRFMKYLRDGNINGVDCRKAYFDATLETFLRQDIKYSVTSG